MVQLDFSPLSLEICLRPGYVSILKSGIRFLRIDISQILLWLDCFYIARWGDQYVNCSSQWLLSMVLQGISSHLPPCTHSQSPSWKTLSRGPVPVLLSRMTRASLSPEQPHVAPQLLGSIPSPHMLQPSKTQMWLLWVWNSNFSFT